MPGLSPGKAAAEELILWNSSVVDTLCHVTFGLCKDYNEIYNVTLEA